MQGTRVDRAAKEQPSHESSIDRLSMHGMCNGSHGGMRQWVKFAVDDDDGIVDRPGYKFDAHDCVRCKSSGRNHV